MMSVDLDQVRDINMKKIPIGMLTFLVIACNPTLWQAMVDRGWEIWREEFKRRYGSGN